MTDRDTITRTRARAPGVGGVEYSTAWRCMIESSGPTQSGPRSDHEMHEGWMQTGWRTADAGSRLKPPITQEGTAWTVSLPAVLGKTRRTEVRPVKTGVFSRR